MSNKIIKWILWPFKFLLAIGSMFMMLSKIQYYRMFEKLSEKDAIKKVNDELFTKK